MIRIFYDFTLTLDLANIKLILIDNLIGFSLKNLQEIKENCISCRNLIPTGSFPVGNENSYRILSNPIEVDIPIGSSCISREIFKIS